MNKKIYEAPQAVLTEFECEDIITTSGGPRSLRKRPEQTDTDYIIVNSKSWNDLFSNNQ